MTEPLALQVNGSRHDLTVDPDRPLLDVLREELDLTGAKFGCGEGQCGACTVLVAGEAVRSCVLPIGRVGDAAVRTIEGLATGDDLHPVQRAFVEATATQCGYCTPGMILAAVALLEADPNPTAGDVIDALNGHLCRCGTYPRIVDAVLDAARAQREEKR